jgi:CubicO group peptidase (beta-lactamase class C family)
MAKTPAPGMPKVPKSVVSRRAALAGLAASAICGSASSDATGERMAKPDAGPVFSPSGPDAERYGAAEGFPIAVPMRLHQPGDPPEKYRVGAYSHYDEIHPTRRVARAASPWMFKRSQADIRYSYRGSPSSLSDYLSRNPVTGLLIAKDDEILFEHYQYGRTDRDRFNSASMAKSITGMLIGIAIAEGAIKSVEDTAETYVAGFKGTEYGRTPIRDLLHMSSGVDFGEERDGGRDLDHLWVDMVNGTAIFRKGTVDSIVQFNRRIAPPGTRFHYASIEPDVLGVVLHDATHTSASDYLQKKVWEPIGAEADAQWLVDAEGFELAHSFFNAVLRDYARLGRLLAHDGLWDGRQIIPAQWMMEATTVRASDTYLAPGQATPGFGYGYFLWLFPGSRRQFALLGDPGQRICVDPVSKLVLVQTAVGTTDELWHLWSSLSAQFSQM